jgi:excisionase family DNA binding protein
MRRSSTQVVLLDKDFWKEEREPSRATDLKIIDSKSFKVAPQYHSVKKVASRFAVGRDAIYDLINAGDLQAIKVGKQWRISEEDLKRYLLLNQLRR